MSGHNEDRVMIGAEETARRNPMRPPDSLPRSFGAALRRFWTHPSPLLISAFILEHF
jgi:hypothetical protein